MVSESLATVRESEDAFTYAQAHWLMAYGYLTQLRYPLAEKYIGSCVRAVEGNPVAFLPHLVRTEGAEDAEISEQSQDRMAFLASLISYRALLRVRVQDAKSGVPPEEAANVLDVRFCIFFSRGGRLSADIVSLQPHNAERQLRILEGSGDGIMNHLDTQFSPELSVSGNRAQLRCKSLWLTICFSVGPLSSVVQDVPSDDQSCDDASCLRFQPPRGIVPASMYGIPVAQPINAYAEHNLI